jgi:hypothetical protein
MEGTRLDVRSRLGGMSVHSVCNLLILNMKLNKTVAKATAKPSVKKATPASVPITTIDVKLDVGFGNALYLRGEGSGLNWERGVPLSCVDGKTWRWSAPVTSPIKCKVLLNDQVWSSGQDVTVTPGQQIEVAPAF